MTSRPPGFTEFVLARGYALHRTALLLTQEPFAAEDLVQTALARAWRSWQRIDGEPEAYVRRIIVHEFLRGKRRRWTGERPTEVLPEPTATSGTLHAPAPPDPGRTTAERLPLVQAMARLPERQRAVLVLRYFHDYTEAMTAEALGISVGSVKTHHSRALAALRITDQLADASPDVSTPRRSAP